MLLIPIHKKVDWKKPPVVTLFLILANILIFMLFQLDDGDEQYDAVAYYQSSGLALIELPAAIAYAKRVNDYELAGDLRYTNEKEFPYWVLSLQTNTEFVRAMERGEVISPDIEKYAEWKRKRERFNELYESITYVGYGLRTAEPTIISLLSHMFLHAGFWHLFGNMLFLFAVGFLVEVTIDSKSYFVSYILMGLGSAAFDFIFRSGELVPGIGASGAISGLMGAYAVLYGMSRIRFFYFIGVYFDYIRLPAIVLLPLWIGNELVQMVINAGSNVNFLAHLGGLCSGALIALVLKRKVSSFSVDHVDQEEHDEKAEDELQQVRELMSAMNPAGAQPLLRRLRAKLPDNREVLTRYYDCCRMKPASDEYHAQAHAIFSLREEDVATDSLVLETFNEYLNLARPSTRMSPALACALAQRFTRQKETTKAEQLVRIILAKKICCPESRKLMRSFIDLLEEQGREKDRQRYLKLISADETT
ncbi:MAG: rhomboid family intramembrane serine protease [Pseudomonadota bacterium]